MACLICRDVKQLSFSEDLKLGNCLFVEKALENIRTHYEFFKSAFVEKNQQVKELKQRNERLMKAIDLLQKQSVHSLTTASQSPSDEQTLQKEHSACKKRRSSAEAVITSPIDDSMSKISKNNSNSNDESLLEESRAQASLLDTGLLSEKLLNSSAISPVMTNAAPSISFAPSQCVNSETIVETERIRSPKGKWLATRRRGLHLSKIKIKSSNNDENLKPRHEIALLNNIENDDKAPSVSKVREKHEKSIKLEDFLKTKNDNIRESVEQNIIGSLASVTKMRVLTSLADKRNTKTKTKTERSPLQTDKRDDNVVPIRNSPALKQTRLLLETQRDISSGGAVKPMRSLTLSSTKVYKRPIQRNASKMQQQSKLKEQDKDDEIFEFAMNDDFAAEIPKYSCNDNTSLFQLKNAESSPNKDESVIAFTPDEVEVIFLDDTEDEMDIMEASAKSHGFFKKPNNTNDCQSSKNENEVDSTDSASTSKSAMEAMLSRNQLLDRESKELGKTGEIKIKNEKSSELIAEPPYGLNENQFEFNVNDDGEKPAGRCLENDEESEEFICPPMIIKEEKKSQNINRLNIKERFDIDCPDCQTYIDILGERLTDNDIQEQLRRCTRHKERERLGHETPAGFWNPFILSMDDNDPRNEVLLDTRFAKKK